MTPEQPLPRANSAPNTRALAVPADKDSLRALFHLFVGKPDCTVKILPRAVQITPACIADLHEQVREKLKNHHIEALVASADLSFEDRTTIQFGGWAEFEAFRWTSPKTTREVRLKWQFLLSVQGYEMPQQHALTVKLCADARPLEVLQAMLSKHPADEDESVVNFAPTTARVDFISNSLATELLAVVENWNSGLRRPEARSDLMSKLDEKKEMIGALIDYSTPLLVALASIGFLRFLFLGQQSSNQALSLAAATGMMQWLMLSLVAIYLSNKVSNFLAKRAYGALDKYGMFAMFKLTNGDQIHIEKLERANTKQVRKFVASVLGSFSLNVAAGVFTAVYWPQ